VAKSEASKVPAKQPEQDPQPELETQLLAEAKTPQERQLAFGLASQVRQADMVRKAALASAEEGWGKLISPMARAATIRYCFSIGADPFRHVNVLGGNIYLNAAFWMDLVASNPKFKRAEVLFIHDDTRASDEDRERRKALRIQYGVPEKAPGAAVVTLFYEGERGPFIGVNWAGVREKDPVGIAEPTKTAETRAYRRAALKAEPAWFGKHPRLKDTTELFVESRVVESRQDAPPSSEVAPQATIAPPAVAEEREPGEEG
jgi:hypothetical protein